MFGNIGFTRRGREREKILKPVGRKALRNLEVELLQLQNKRAELSENMELSDDELSEQIGPIQLKIDKLINDISALKYENNR
jgi:hypothetical protein